MPGLRISIHWELRILATNPLCSEWRCRWTENRRTKGSLYNDASFCLSNWILCRASVANRSRGNSVGSVFRLDYSDNKI